MAGLLGISLMWAATAASGAEVRLAWDPSSEAGIEGYGVYFRKDAAGPPYTLFGYIGTEEFSDPANPTVAVTGLTKDSRYYFAVTAYNAAGAESGFSGSVCAQVGDLISPCPTTTVTDGGSSGGGSTGGGGSGGGSGGGACFIATAADAAGGIPLAAGALALGVICRALITGIARRRVAAPSQRETSAF